MKSLKELWNNWLESIKISNDGPYKDEILILKNQIKTEKDTINILKEKIEELKNEISELNKDINILEEESENDLIGEKWNESRPKVTLK